MEKEYLIKLSKLSKEEQIERDLYLRDIAIGEIAGPMVGCPSIDKPWLKWYTPEDIKASIPQEISMYEYMKANNNTNRNRIAINYYGNIITYQEMIDKIEIYATKFKKLGVKKGDVISICMLSTPETIYMVYALNILGAVCDMIDPRSNPKQLEYYLKENKSNFVIMCDLFYKKHKEILDKLQIEKVINLPIGISAPLITRLILNSITKKNNYGVKISNNVMTWKYFEQLEGITLNDTDRVLNDDAIIVHSSGTTSIPKGIILSNTNVNYLSLQYKRTKLPIGENSRFLSVIPVFASFGMVASIHLPFCLSMTNYILPIVTPKSFAKNVINNKINFTLTVPDNIKYISRIKKKIDLSCFYGPGAGGYSVNSTTETEINNGLKRNKCPSPILMGYGASETSSTATLETKETSKILSSGIPLVKMTVAIFDPNTHTECRYNEEGEICITGPTLMNGYLNNPEKTNKILVRHEDGLLWYHTGDLGVMDTEGRLYPIDRIERMIIKSSTGLKIRPQKSEEIISKSKYVETCLTVGYQDLNRGVIPKTYIVLKEEYINNEKEAINDITNLCKQLLDAKEIPEIEIIPALPYTPLGKPDFKLLERGLQLDNQNCKKRTRKK